MFQVLADGNNNLWMTSNHGISSAQVGDILATAEDKQRKVTVKFYSKNDGLDSDGPTSTAKSMVDRKGRVWFAMVDGIAIYDPVSIFENTIMPLVQVESVVVELDGTIFSSMRF